jgi:hypothetical protein
MFYSTESVSKVLETESVTTRDNFNRITEETTKMTREINGSLTGSVGGYTHSKVSVDMDYSTTESVTPSNNFNSITEATRKMTGEMNVSLTGSGGGYTHSKVTVDMDYSSVKVKDNSKTAYTDFTSESTPDNSQVTKGFTLWVNGSADYYNYSEQSVSRRAISKGDIDGTVAITYNYEQNDTDTSSTDFNRYFYLVCSFYFYVSLKK